MGSPPEAPELQRLELSLEGIAKPVEVEVAVGAQGASTGGQRTIDLGEVRVSDSRKRGCDRLPGYCTLDFE